MRGEISVINNVVSKREDNPIKSSIGKHDPAHIIAVINDEYWKHFRYKMNFSPNSCLILDNLGTFTLQYSRFKYYIRQLIKQLRKSKNNLERLKLDPKFDINNSETYVIYISIKAKLQASWQQLEEMRKLHILRYLLYTYKKYEADNTFVPKKNYTWFDFSFKKQLLHYNANIDLKAIHFKK